MRNKNKGFTLIELLTVIAILAVILLIAAPIILGSLEKAKKNNFKNQALLYVDGLKKEVLLDSMSDNPNIVLPTSGKSLSINISDIPMDSTTDITGNIVITNNNGKYSYVLYITNGEYTICNKEYNKIKVEDIKKGDTCGDALLYPSITNKYSEQIYNLNYNITRELILNGVSASDTRDGDITSKITYTGSVDTTKIGDYEIIYSVENSLGNISTTKRVIHVKDIESPIITNSIAKEEIEKGSTYNRYLEGIQVSDNYDSNIEATYICKNGILQVVECSSITNKAGVYYIIYDAIDSSNNKYSETGKEEVRREIVVRDIDAPVITLKGDNPLTIEVGSTFREPGYEAIDDEDGDITDRVESSSNLNTRVVGEYTVQYIVVDSSNNRGIETRTINVVDIEPPVIESVTGNPTSWTTSATLTIEASDNYRLHNEPYSYDDGETWTSNNTKEYTENKEVRIKVRDEAGNISDAYIVNIDKVDSTEPQVSLSGIPDIINYQDNYQLPTSYTVGPSGGSAVCKIGDTVLTNTSTLAPGTHTINCTITTGIGNIKEASKKIKIKSPEEVSLLYSGAGACISSRINDNSVASSSSSVTQKIDLNKAGYTFDYVLKPSYGSISFCDNNNTCETLASQSGENNIYTGSYTTTKPGYINMNMGRCDIEINNIKYNGLPVDIIPAKASIFSSDMGNKCINNQGNISCETKGIQNNSVVSGNVYFLRSNTVCYSGKTEIKINDDSWKKVSAGPMIYYGLPTMPGTYRVKIRYNYSSTFPPYYSSESDEYVITIQK